MRRLLGLQVVFLIAILLLAALPARAEDLLTVYGLAVQHDPRLRAAQAALEATREDRAQARALLRPSITAGTGLIRTWPDNLTNGVETQYQLSINQPLYLREASVQARQAEARIARAEAELEQARQELRLRTSTAYFNVLAALDDLESIRAERTAVARHLEQVRQRFAVGFSTIIDIHEAQARHDLVTAAEIAAENQLVDRREQLGEITGHFHAELASLDREIPFLLPEPPEAAPWVEKALQQSPQLQAARHGLQAAREEIHRRRAAHYPGLNAVASYRDGERWSDSGLDHAPRTTVGVQLNVALYQGGRVASQVRQAEFRSIQAGEELEQVRRAVERETRSGLAGVLTRISQVQALQQASRSSETALEATTAGFQAGTRTVLEVLDAQRELYRTRRDHSRARYDYLLETLRLKRAAGFIDDADLRLINDWLRQGDEAAGQETEILDYLHHHTAFPLGTDHRMPGQ